MSGRIRAHLRTHVIGYVALFVALSGTAYAANTVGSQDIINGEVKSVDIGNTEVKSADIGAGEVMNQDIADDAVDRLAIADDAVHTAEIGNDQVRSADVLDASLTGADLAGGHGDAGQPGDDRGREGVQPRVGDDDVELHLHVARGSRGLRHRRHARRDREHVGRRDPDRRDLHVHRGRGVGPERGWIQADPGPGRRPDRRGRRRPRSGGRANDPERERDRGPGRGGDRDGGRRVRAAAGISTRGWRRSRSRSSAPPRAAGRGSAAGPARARAQLAEEGGELRLLGRRGADGGVDRDAAQLVRVLL